MGAYLDRLTAEFDEITGLITERLERAADESRDLNPDEQSAIEREDKRRDEIQKAIDVQTAIEERTAKVANVRARVGSLPATPVRVREPEQGFDIGREFPSAGHYAAMLLRSGRFTKDPDVIRRVESIARANQTTADNPGIIPRPIVGDLLGRLPGLRPFVGSVPNPQATVGTFDRPVITQHVDIGVQAGEKTQVASRQMIIGKVPVTLETYAGHVNVSRQDLRWTSPSILQVLFSDFTAVYAQETDNAACDDFVAGCTVTSELPGAAGTPPTAADIEGALRGAVGTIGQNASGAVPNTLWMSSDMWSDLGGLMTSDTSGVKAFNLPLTGGGDVLGLRPVLDFNFAPSTLIVGASSYVECWEDLDGFLTVDEPDLHGQDVGYAGYFDTVVLDPDAFVKIINATE